MGQQAPDPAQTSTAFFRRIAEEAPVAVAMAVAPEWRVVYANPAYRALVGECPEVIGSTLAELFPGGDDEARIGEALRGRRTVTTQGLPRPGLRPSWWDEDIHPLPEPDGTIPAVLIMGCDVTAHVRARQEADAARAALARQAEQLRLAIGAAGMFFWDWDLATDAVEWSAGLEAVCGMAPGSFGGTLAAFRALVHPDDLPRVEAEIARALAGKAAFDTEFRMRRADGGLCWVGARGTVLRDAAGRPVRMIGIDRDITRRRLAEETLRANEERLRLAQEAAQLGMWEYHPLSQRSVLSAGYREIHGLDEAQATGLDLDGWLALVHPEDRERMSALTLGMLTAGKLDTEFRILRADTGELRWVHSRAALFQGEEGPVLRGIIQDVTARRLAQATLEAAVETRGLLIREADHRIKNSLQLVAALLRAQETRTTEPEVRRALRAAFARVMAIGECHRSLYQSADLRTIDLSLVLADLARHAGALATTLTVRCDLPTSLPLDAERAIPLGLLVNELATNAVKHAYPAGQPGLVTLRAEAGPQEIMVSVADAGAGLPPDDTRACGLGATLVQALGRQIGARIETRSTPDGGTLVCIRLPREPARRSAPAGGPPGR